MRKTIAQLTDTVFANSSALDVVLGSFDFGTDTSPDDVIGCSDEPLTIRTEAKSRIMKAVQERQKRRLPWLGL